MCFRVRFMIKQVVCWLWCSNISKNNSYINFVLSMTSITFLISVNNFVMLLLLWFSSAPTCIVCSVVQCSSHDYWIIFCIAHWFQYLYMLHFILKSCSLFCSSLKLKTGSSCPLTLTLSQINHPVSFLFKKPITSWILDATWKEQTQV